MPISERICGKGSCQVKKNPRKIRIYQNAPTHPPIQFKKKTETFGNMKNAQKTQKNTTFPQKKLKSELGLDPPTHFRFFLEF